MQNELDQLIDGLPIAVYGCEAPSGVIRFYNRKAAELWGREPEFGTTDEKFCGSLRLFRIDGSPLRHSETPMAAALRDGQQRADEVVIERPDGSRITVEVAISPLHDADGRVCGAVNAFQDITARTKAEEALRLSEARLRAIVEDQPEMVCRFLPDGTMTFANEAYCRYFGLRREDVFGKSYAPIVHPDDMARVEESLAALTPESPVVVIENRVRRADGAMRWTHWTNHALYDDDGRIRELQSTGRDTTDQKRAEEDAARLAAVVEGAQAAILSKSLDGVITSWNRAAERLFGYTAAEVVGRNMEVLVPPARASEEAEILERIRRGIATPPFETERLRKDGTPLPVSLNVSPVRDASGCVIGASTIARDITDRQRANEDLQSSLRMLEVLYRLADRIGRASTRKDVTEAAVEAIVAAAKADRASVLLFDELGNMRFESWRGLSETYRKAVDGHSPWTCDEENPLPILVEDVLLDPHVAELRSVITSEGIRALAFIPLVYHGRLLGKFMVYYDVPHRFSDDELRLSMTIAQHAGAGLTRVDSEAAVEYLLDRERTARVEADASRAAAERANRAKDEFLAMLSHELRNPLSVIVNAVEVIGTNEQTTASPMVAMIRRQTEHLTALLDDLLDVARITSGRIEIERESVDLVSVVEETVEAQRHRTEAKGQTLTLSRPDRSVIVDGDPVRLRQVLENLVNNASKYAAAGGSIEVALEARDGNAIVTVRDDGAGIAAEKLDAIFDLFVQADSTLARTEGGLGIGLTLVKRVVELHGGEVRAASDGPGRGAALTVQLPLTHASAPTKARVVESRESLPLRVLVIEDHDDGRRALISTLKVFGHETTEASSGTEGIAMMERERPDVVLVDIGLPDIDGYEVARRLRRSCGDRLRLVALTGYGQPADRERSSAAGFDLHLVKPVEPSKLREILDRLARPPAIA